MKYPETENIKIKNFFDACNEMIQGRFILSDITTNYERISDHCSNVAIGIIQSKEDIYESHEYLETLDKSENTPFYEKYEEYKERYILP